MYIPMTVPIIVSTVATNAANPRDQRALENNLVQTSLPTVSVPIKVGTAKAFLYVTST